MAVDHMSLARAHLSPGSLSDHAPRRVVAIALAPLPVSPPPPTPSTTGAVVRPQPKGGRRGSPSPTRLLAGICRRDLTDALLN